jgi:2-keto-3-deoxy-L-rhamnonate aldolase RhmA
MLRRIEQVPIGTVVRLPNADAAPIGRVADAGADAVVIAMIESADQAAAAVAAIRYPPAGIRSFGPLRASLGRDTAALESRVSVFAMIETAAALSGLSQICAVDGLTGLYVGPADLAISMGVDVVGATKHPAVLDAIGRIQRAAADVGLVSGIHAGDGKTGRTMAQLGFRMITLAAESQALRSGAAEHLREATDG